jgi:hypothetical protein
LRPRISMSEAAYLVELLNVSLEILNEYENYYKALGKSVNQIEFDPNKDSYSKFMDGLFEKKKELQQWTDIRNRVSYIVYEHQQLHERLLVKYKNIAENNHKRGVYKHSSHLIGYIEPNEIETLKPILLREFQPIDEIGKRQPLTNEQRLTH